MAEPKYNLRTRNQPKENQKSPNHKCDLCGLHFVHAARLNAHIVSIHQQKQKADHKCYSCDKTFTSSVKLKNHIYIFHEQKRKIVQVTNGNITPNILDLEKNRGITITRVHNVHTDFVHESHKDYRCKFFSLWNARKLLTL